MLYVLEEDSPPFLPIPRHHTDTNNRTSRAAELQQQLTAVVSWVAWQKRRLRRRVRKFVSSCTTSWKKRVLPSFLHPLPPPTHTHWYPQPSFPSSRGAVAADSRWMNVLTDGRHLRNGELRLFACACMKAKGVPTSNLLLLLLLLLHMSSSCAQQV